MRTDRVARVRAGFGRAALSNPNGATSRTARRAPPRRPGPSVAAPLFVGWDGIGPVRRSRASDGRSSRGKVEAVEDCRSRPIVQDERDEIQAATALTGQCVDVMEALRSSAQSIRVDGSRTAAGTTSLGATGATQCGAGSLHRRARMSKVDGFTIRATAIAVVAAVLSGEQLPFSSR